MILNDIIKKLEDIAPLFLAEEGDPTGFQVGDRNAQINTAVICMDVTNKVIDFAIDNKAEFIISHHPFIHTPLTSLDKTSIEGGKIYKLIENSRHSSKYNGYSQATTPCGSYKLIIACKIPFRKTEGGYKND